MDIPRSELYRQASRRDFYTFAQYMFECRTNGEWIRAPHHAAIAVALERVFAGITKRLIINIPPRYSKTELAVVMWIAWCLGQYPDAEFIHASYSSTLAANNSANVLRIIQHEEYKNTFPYTELDSTARTHWKTTAGGVMYSTGSGGTLTGFGAGRHRDTFGGAIVIDDPHKPDEVRSDAMRKNVIEWYQNTLASRVNSRETPIILIMQRLHEEDLAGWLLNGGTGEDWEHLCLPAINQDGTALWPAKHSIEDLRRLEQASPYVFAGQYLQVPAPPSGGLFRPGQISIIDAIPHGVTKWIRGWDLAATTDGDYTAGAKIGKLPDGRFVIADIQRDRLGPDERDALIRNTAMRDSGDTLISIPQDPGQAGKTLALHHTRMLQGYRVITTPESGDKITRAEPFASQVNVGNVVMLRAPWNDSLFNEMAMFPNGKHDDQIDALSRSFAELVAPLEPVQFHPSLYNPQLKWR